MLMRLKSLGLSLLGISLLGLTACGGEQQSLAPEGESAVEAVKMAKIEGEVFYRERIMIAPDSEIEVQLEDISRADALATVMASVSFQARGGPPYAFAIEYDPARIDSRMRYALRARITSPDGELMFTNTEYIDPFSGNPVQVLVQGMARPTPVPEPEPAQQPEPRPEAQPAAPTADAASGQASDGAIVWELASLGGDEAPVGAGGKPVDLQMNPVDSTATGFSGCNRYSGSFSNKGRSTHGTPIKFGPLAGTMMACPEGGDLEQAYLQTLAGVDAYRMRGGELALMSGDKVVATFKPR
jgi:putative lipoprotein